VRDRGIVVNSKVRRLTWENDLQPKRHKRFVAKTDSDHDGPIFPDLARHRILDSAAAFRAHPFAGRVTNYDSYESS
jgi:hypothetical protein